MSLNTLSPDGKEQYTNRQFTPEGYKTLHTYTQELCKIWYKTKEYPVKMGMVYGIPLFKYAQEIKNKDELMGRIKAYCQILGIEEVSFEVNNTTITINMEGKNNGN